MLTMSGSKNGVRKLNLKSLILWSAMLGTAALIWFSKNTTQTTTTSEESTKTPIALSPPTLPITELVPPTTETTVPESERHASGEIERHRESETRRLHLIETIKNQEEKVETSRKKLTALVRTTSIVYKKVSDAEIPEAHNDTPPQNSLAEEYAHAKHDFEKEQLLLSQLRLKQLTHQATQNPAPAQK
jgi:hypothetical protein